DSLCEDYEKCPNCKKKAVIDAFACVKCFCVHYCSIACRDHHISSHKNRCSLYSPRFKMVYEALRKSDNVCVLFSLFGLSLEIKLRTLFFFGHSDDFEGFLQWKYRGGANCCLSYDSQRVYV